MFGCGILHQVTVRNVGASQLDVVPPLACQYAEGPSRVGGGGSSTSESSFFSVAPRLYCYHEGAWNSLAVGTEEF
jgi:hypothetical protein